MDRYDRIFILFVILLTVAVGIVHWETFSQPDCVITKEEGIVVGGGDHLQDLICQYTDEETGTFYYKYCELETCSGGQ